MAKKYDDISTRMKSFYESVPKISLIKRCPVIIRVDGRAFHTFLKGFRRPFDNIVVTSMNETMKALCENIPGCVLGYKQSDEISLLLIDYETLTSSAWFDYEVQKLDSIAASMTTLYFNRIFDRIADAKIDEMLESWNRSDEDEKYIKTLGKAIATGAMFDARCFNIPREEVTNYFYWRQSDATRNSIEMVGHTYFSQSELHKKTCNMIQDMLHEQKNINWNDYPVPYKRGVCCIKSPTEITRNGQVIVRNKWNIDENIPIFSGNGRDYIEKLIYPDK